MLPAFTPTWWAAVSCALAAAAILPDGGSAALAQTPLGDSITYQGLLKQSGAPVNGNADFEFRLFDGAGGAALQVGSTLALNNVALTDGVFTVSLDFGDDLYDGSERWLEIAVRVPAGGGGGLTTLTPRQLLRGAPYALFALAGNQGPQGPVGPQGIQGPPGPAGDSHWPLNGNNTYFNTGNVGIGTDTPSTPLYVVGEMHSDERVSFGTFGSGMGNDQGGSMELGPTNDNGGQQPYIDMHYGGGVAQDFSARIQAAAADRLLFATNAGPAAMQIKGVNVGIGTADPLHSLHVASSGEAGLLIENAAAVGIGDGVVVDVESPLSFAVWARQLANSASGGAAVRAEVNANNYAGWFVGGRTYFDGTDVGINISSPAADLHVNGTSRFESGMTANGAITANGTFTASLGVTLPTTTRRTSVHAGSFVPWDDAVEYSALNYLQATNAAQSVIFHAAVQLPDGAIVTFLEAGVLDSAAVENVTVEIARVSNTGTETQMASDTSSGSGGAQTLSDNTIQVATVNNDLYAYFVRLSWPVPATTSEIRVYRVQINYTITSPLP